MDMSQSLWALFSAWRCCCCVSEAAAETVSKAAKPVVAALAEAGTSSSKEGRESSSSLSVSPILASLLGLNRIKTRSGPLPQESFFGFRGEKGTAVLGGNNLSRPGVGARAGGWGDKGSNSDSVSTSGSLPSREQSPVVLPPSRLQNGESSSEAAACSELGYCSYEADENREFLFKPFVNVYFGAAYIKWLSNFENK
ncbi:hypothetical protein JHK85_000810 [Glycine max]|uniref:Uncharacterized protein n=1 Tax=Glycine max TaxID=3847 RepID=A0A0R0L7Q4_SOYBN|nr:hypothetical protein JHK85_000810 [Glycine max]